VIRRLLDGETLPPKPAAPMRLDRDHDKLLQGLFASTAYGKFREGRQQELKFADACRAGRAVLASGQSISGDDTGLLCDLHDYLRQRFSPHLTLLRKRAVRP
jgi:hypothetical protein